MKPLRRRHPHPEIPLVSTADVAFLLLIFFLSTATLSVERGILLGLPRPEGEVLTLRPDRVVRVAVAADRSMSLDGAAIAPADLKRALASRLKREPGLVVTLAIHHEAPYAAMVEALDQIKLSGARQISLRTEAGS